ncbi:MAG TPA: aspartate aminotransferase family protein [Gammaproteobacteria bacterium]|nr:aspartate aminotransferase family protein [Gammaproteobacteria bacterium]
MTQATATTPSAIMPTYFFQLPIAFEKGEGIWLYDAEGKKYLDGLCGISVTNLGHSHPVITKAICDQAAKLIHTSNTFQIPAQQILAQKLVKLSGMEQVYFCNSGAEANEAAIKISRMFARKKNISNPAIVVMENGFHGRTMGVVGACNKRTRGGFEPFLPDFVRVPYDDLEAIKSAAHQYENIVAVMVEPIQGESGVHIPNENYLKGIREICDQHDWLMILDEVQTGLGRTGKWFDCQHFNVLPDIMTLAKSLAGGLPIGACLARGKASNMFQPGKHGTTFGGNPLVCTAGLAVLNTLEKDNLVKNAETMGNYVVKKLKETLGKKSEIKDIRGRGLMIGIEFDRPCRDLMAIGLKHGMLFIISADKVIRLLPPLIITQADADEIVKRLNLVADEFLNVR